MSIRLGIITISDRASAGEYEDHGGPALRARGRGGRGRAGTQGLRLLHGGLVPFLSPDGGQHPENCRSR